MPACSKLIVDLAAIKHNIDQFAKNNAVMVMGKANGYGTDIIKLAPYLQQFGVHFLGVSHVEEGIKLRESGIKMPILVLSAPPFEAAEVVHYQLQPAVNSLEEIEALSRYTKKMLPIHLNINTGLNRFGTALEEANHLVKAIEKARFLQLEGVMTHLAAADLPLMDSFTHLQLSSFEKVIKTLKTPPRWIHAANSAGAQRFSLPFCNLVRVGVALFGYGVDLARSREQNALKPALTFVSHLCHTHTVKKGQSIGYYRSYHVIREKMRIGIIPVGYYDGIHRHYKEKGYVLIQGKKAHMIGHICMDFMMVDLSEIPEAHVGDRVTIFDGSLRPETVASWGNTDVRELLVNIGPRTERVFVEP